MKPAKVWVLALTLVANGPALSDHFGEQAKSRSLKADIWFWKAHRTDHAGFADDKMHIYSPIQTANTQFVLSRHGLRNFLARPGDAGDAAWTIEFARKLVTGHADDVQFDLARQYRFGVSRFETAARQKTPNLEEAYFGAGEITEILQLVFR